MRTTSLVMAIVLVFGCRQRQQLRQPITGSSTPGVSQVKPYSGPIIVHTFSDDAGNSLNLAGSSDSETDPGRDILTRVGAGVAVAAIVGGGYIATRGKSKVKPLSKNTSSYTPSYMTTPEFSDAALGSGANQPFWKKIAAGGLKKPDFPPAWRSLPEENLKKFSEWATQYRKPDYREWEVRGDLSTDDEIVEIVIKDRGYDTVHRYSRERGELPSVITFNSADAADSYRIFVVKPEFYKFADGVTIPKAFTKFEFDGQTYFAKSGFKFSQRIGSSSIEITESLGKVKVVYKSPNLNQTHIFDGKEPPLVEVASNYSAFSSLEEAGGQGVAPGHYIELSSTPEAPLPKHFEKAKSEVAERLGPTQTGRAWYQVSETEENFKHITHHAWGAGQRKRALEFLTKSKESNPQPYAVDELKGWKINHADGSWEVYDVLIGRLPRVRVANSFDELSEGQLLASKTPREAGTGVLVATHDGFHLYAKEGDNIDSRFMELGRLYDDRTRTFTAGKYTAQEVGKGIRIHRMQDPSGSVINFVRFESLKNANTSLRTGDWVRLTDDEAQEFAGQLGKVENPDQEILGRFQVDSGFEPNDGRALYQYVRPYPKFSSR